MSRYTIYGRVERRAMEPVSILRIQARMTKGYMDVISPVVPPEELHDPLQVLLNLRQAISGEVHRARADLNNAHIE